ncbi:putative ribonuclease H-like domain-containing protein [Tanacetum coccineum]
MNQFCEMKGIKREFSVARTPQQNGVAERKNRQKISTDRQKLVLLSQNKTVYKEWEDRTEKAATTASSLDAEQDIGCDLRFYVTILRDADAQTRIEAASKQFNDPPLSRGYTLRSGEDSMKLLELMELCIKLSDLVSKKKREML